MYGIEITLTAEKAVAVRDLAEIRVFDGEKQIETVKPEQFFNFSWLLGRRYSFVGRQNASIINGEDIAYVSFFLER